ncbi:unnamed protein product [Cylindrotheca closterium]|uniref:RRM domain-containing protein n=1 Tax=Cylindrotheca closterium TaxID=2856 RepID=A0AAD2FD01_9STRA|nr:unnamed protein product [Cylindrotheca closterium]
MPKSTDNTVFVRLVPTPQQKVMRHQIEDIFSQIGPIKKSSWINSGNNEASKGYGFVKYVSDDDAKNSVEDLHNTKMQMDGIEYTLKVELASAQSEVSKEKPSSSHDKRTRDVDDQIDEAVLMKKRSRIIIRNLSFYAKENHIRTAMSKYGEVVEVHLPRVKSNLHVGFCFVTFRNSEDAKKAVDETNLSIQKRTVSMDWSIPKNLHQQQKNQQKNVDQDVEMKGSDSEKNDDESDGSDDRSENDDSRTSSGSENESHSDGGSDNDEDDESGDEVQDKAASVKEQRTLFVRNLPFDSTRHDIFQLFSKFGYIESIYLVKDKSTGMLKGTAFVTFSNPRSAQKATQDASFVSQRQAADSSENKSESSMLLRGRQIYVNMAVDRETAETFDSKEMKTASADRRNMYLQAEARVESTSQDPNANNANTWDDLPQQDQRKRQHALKDKTTKLQSPIFFINPNRLSFRNLAKHVDEAGLHQLLEKATKRGLEKNLVTAKDQIAHWRALGEMSTRDILSKVQSTEAEGGDIISGWESKSTIKDYIPSVFIDRDFGQDGKKANASSRGFAFAEFTHHAHALACLRELNNNPEYSGQYAAGGKIATATKKKARKGRAKVMKGTGGGDYIGEDGRVRVPRLIVDFVVENKVKAKKQAERRLQQQVNQAKQKLDKLEKQEDAEPKKKRSRGSIQREKKRHKRESGEEETEKQTKLLKREYFEKKKILREEKKAKQLENKKKGVKPPKKKSIDKEEEKLEKLVGKYRSDVDTTKKNVEPRGAVREKRWFD